MNDNKTTEQYLDEAFKNFNENPKKKNFNCPKCGSEHITTFRNIYEGGTASINTTSFGGGVNAGTNGVGGIFGTASTSGTSQSLAAQRYAPPKWLNLKAMTVANIVMGILAFTAGREMRPFGFFLLFCTILGQIYASNYMKKWSAKYAKWENSWHCNKCGNNFLID